MLGTTLCPKQARRISFNTPILGRLHWRCGMEQRFEGAIVRVDAATRLVLLQMFLQLLR